MDFHREVSRRRRTARCAWTASGWSANPDRGQGQTDAATDGTVPPIELEHGLDRQADAAGRTARGAGAAACEQVGRDPSTLEVTVGVTTAFPDLAPDEIADLIDPDRVLTGTAEEMAAVFKEYEALGAEQPHPRRYTRHRGAVGAAW